MLTGPPLRPAPSQLHSFIHIYTKTKMVNDQMLNLSLKGSSQDNGWCPLYFYTVYGLLSIVDTQNIDILVDHCFYVSDIESRRFIEKPMI